MRDACASAALIHRVHVWRLGHGEGAEPLGRRSTVTEAPVDAKPLEGRVSHENHLTIIADFHGHLPHLPFIAPRRSRL